MGKSLNKFGSASGVNGPAIIWTGHANGAADIMPATPGVLTIQSSSIEDAAGQTGATGVESTILSLFDGIYRKARITATLNGTSNATLLPSAEDSDTSLSFRCVSMEVFGPSGSNDTNVGTISALIDGVVCCEIAANAGASDMGMISFGGDEVGEASLVETSLIDAGPPGTNAGGRTRFRARPFGGSTRDSGTKMLLGEAQTSHTVPFPNKVKLSSNADYWVEITEVNNGPADFAARISAELFSVVRSAWVAAP